MRLILPLKNFCNNFTINVSETISHSHCKQYTFSILYKLIVTVQLTTFTPFPDLMHYNEHSVSAFEAVDFVGLILIV